MNIPANSGLEANKFKKIIIYLIVLMFGISLLNSCGLYRPVDARKVAQTAKEKRRQNIEEGKGISIGNVLGSKGTNYEFSTSNPLWRASLEVLDFLPLTTVDYSGGIIITDWYSDNKTNNESLKLTVRFLSNEITSNSLKIIIHQKKCLSLTNCSTIEINSKIKEELTKSILSKAAKFEKDQKKK